MASSLFLILRHFQKDHPICMCLSRGFFITFVFLILNIYFCLFVCYCCLLFVLLFLQTKCYIILCCTLFFLIVLIVIVVLVYQQLNSILPEDGWFFLFLKKILSYTFYFVCECIYYYYFILIIFFSFFSMVLYMASSFWLLGVESCGSSQAEKERTACSALQTVLSFSSWEKSRDSTPNSQKLEDM